MKLSRLFSRYLISFILVFLIPLLSLGLFVNQYLFNVLLEKELENRKASLSLNVSMIEMRMDELNKLCLQISSDAAMKPFNYEEIPFNVYTIIRKISHYTFTNNFLSSLYILFRSDSYFYSGSNGVSVPYFYDKMITRDTMPELDFRNIIYDSVTQKIWSSKDSIIITKPYPVGSKNPKGTILIMVAKETLQNFLITDREEKICVTSSSGEILLGDRTLLAGDQSKNVVIYRSEKSGWEYRILVNRNMIYQKINPVRRIFLVILFAILVVGFIISTLVTFYHYQPIKKMALFFASQQGENPRNKDEFELIRTSFINVIKEEEDLRQEVEERELIIKKAILTRLLNGRITSPDTLHKAGFDMDSPYFLIAIIKTKEEWRNFLSDDYRIMQWEFESEIITAHIITDYSCIKQQFTAIINLSFPCKGEKSFSFLNNFFKQWKREDSSRIVLSLSSIKRNISQVGEAYLEALTAINYNWKESNRGILSYESLPIGADSEINYPYKEIEKMRGAIENGKVPFISDSRDRLIEVFKSAKLDMISSRRLYFNIMNTILMGLQKGEKLKEEELPIPDMFSLEQLDSLKEMINLVDKSIDRIIELIEKKKGDRPDYLSDLLDYLDENYTDSNLSLQSLSDLFHFTPAYLSASFKKHIQRNISDYIGELRIEKSKELLESSELPLKAIVSHLGYTDTSSFIRKFRSRENMTPGEYRANKKSI